MNHSILAGTLFPGSPDGNGKPAKLDSQSYIEIADGERLFFLLPKGRLMFPNVFNLSCHRKENRTIRSSFFFQTGRTAPVEKPKFTYEQLIVSVLEPDRQLTFPEIVAEIQSRHPYYNNGELISAKFIFLFDRSFYLDELFFNFCNDRYLCMNWHL
jgi:hypothetical protein